MSTAELGIIVHAVALASAIAVFALGAVLKLGDVKAIVEWMPSNWSISVRRAGAVGLIAFDASATGLLLWLRGTPTATAIAAALSGVLLLVHAVLATRGIERCPCLGRTTLLAPWLPIALLSITLVLCATSWLISLTLETGRSFAPPLWLPGLLALALVAVLMFRSSLAARRLARDAKGALAPSLASKLEQLLGSGEAMPSRIALFFGSLSCEACLAAAEDFSNSSSGSHDGTAYLMDMGFVPRERVRVGRARLVASDPDLRKAIGIRTRPSIAVIESDTFHTFAGADGCARAIDRLSR